MGGRDGTALAQHEDELADRGVIRHDIPVLASKEVGADVELALTCYEIAVETRPDMIALLAGDSDFAPLAARLTGRGIRVLAPSRTTPIRGSVTGPCTRSGRRYG